MCVCVCVCVLLLNWGFDVNLADMVMVFLFFFGQILLCKKEGNFEFLNLMICSKIAAHYDINQYKMQVVS